MSPMTQPYVEKPVKVSALQWHTGDPLPDGVDTCDVFPGGPVPHGHTDAGMKLLLDTYWVLYHFRSSRLLDILPPTEFDDRFGAGPPTAEGQPA
jgi:hypothetical protein